MTSDFGPDDECAVFISFDNPFSLAAAALIGSIVKRKQTTRALTIYMAGIDVTRRNRVRIEAIAAGRKDVNLHWLSLDGALRRHLQELYTRAKTFYPPAAYSRLVMDSLLPAHVSRIVYLDVDTILRRDVCDLYDTPMDGNVMLAAIDPLVAASGSAALCGVGEAPGNATMRYGEHLSALVARANTAGLSFAGDQDYYQSGVLVIDVTAYRNHRCAERMLEATGRIRDLPFPDQDALNIVLAGRIGTLDPRWNMVATLYGLFETGRSPLPADSMNALLSDPWLVHFTSRPKPWHLGCTHPFASEWHAALHGTAFQDWTPNRLNQSLARIPRGLRVARKLLARRLGAGGHA
ncbi:glycosyltransferase family 8 protein [Roseivivax sediminis]|uniref:Lipopolysaccharide biosynthesis protein, LPS:glycosyltransferase n=1 Tax=Roseivivax sediminis TaxID=936889 RepID=A0A1I2DIF3_9RHOB|nr:glycosyltransferase family 8 protein [Roseivivax sediminis]SFE80013.1 Lipopolysaccharide biosynthesis protein, LPS:glycosyltransferase [Roseivivax sediminis]